MSDTPTPEPRAGELVEQQNLIICRQQQVMMDCQNDLVDAKRRITDLEAQVAEAREIMTTYSKVYGVLKDYDREKFRAFLERTSKP